MTTDSLWNVDDINLSDLDFWRRPWDEREAAFEALRLNRPISFYESAPIEGTSIEMPPSKGYNALTRYRDVATATRNTEVFLSGPGAVSQMDLPPEMVEYFSGMISTDNPKHARLRRIVSNAFSPRNVRTIDDIAAPFVLEIICTMMGVPASDYPTVLKCSNVILSNGDPEYNPEGTDPLLAVLEAGSTLTTLMEEIGKYRLDNPVDDITSALVNAEIESEKLTHQELASFFVLLVAAGNETTRTALGHALLTLSDHPDQKARLLSDFEGRIGAATDEIVRWATPVIWMRRTLSVDYTLSGHELEAGDKVLLFYNSANRDEEVFKDPHVFDIGRTPNDHYGFGAPGPHFCLGAHMARREITVLLRKLYSRAPDVHYVGEPSRLTSSFINGITHLSYEC
jgi:cytochrome P450